MKRWMGVLAVTFLAAASCDMGRKDPAVTAGSAVASPPASVEPVAIVGSGSTLQRPFHEVAIDAFATKDIKITYGGGGSGKGRQDLADMVVDYAGTDAPFKDADRSKTKGGDVLYVPILLAPIAVAYNLDGLTGKLRLSPVTLAKIFQGGIKTWSDPAIAADNPGAKLPAVAIVVVHRADGSSTTASFTKFLDRASGGVWRLQSGAVVEWPEDMQAASSDTGVAQVVKLTKGAIGYIDLADAKAAELVYASIGNRTGTFVEPTADSATAAGDGVDVADDLTFSALDAKGEASYPITAQSWVIVYAKQTATAKAAALRAYLMYLLTDAQQQLRGLDLAPLPRSLRDRAIAQLAKIRG